MLKKGLQAILQRVFGFENYLYWFCRVKLRTFRYERLKDSDFSHFLRLLSPQSRVLDIGANIGLMTVQIARTCPQGKVIAFEPVPANFRTLQRIVAHYQLDHVVLRQLALGAVPGQLTMKMPVMKGVKMQGLAYIDDGHVEGYNTAYESCQVPVETLDGLDLLRNFPVDAIKIDVENYEQFVFRGGLNLLRRDMPVIYCELWPNDNRREVFALLQPLGYDIFVIDAGKLVPFKPEQHLQENFFFLPPGRTLPQ